MTTLHTNRNKMPQVVAGLAQGLTLAQVADATGVSQNTISQWKRRDGDFQLMLESANEAVAAAIIEGAVDVVRLQIKDMGAEAQEVLKRSLASDDERLALTAAGMVFRLGDFVNRDVNVKVGVEQHLAALGSSNPVEGD